MYSQSVLCSLCLDNLNDSKNVYSIIKCGHIYHKECLRKIIYKRTCSVCHVLYDKRQCRKLNVYSESKVQSEDGFYPWEYNWMYCDSKTLLEPQELSKTCLKLGIDNKNDDIYAARCFLNGNILPAYYVAARKCAITTFGGHAYQLQEDIDLLDISADDIRLYEWQQFENNQLPENAFDITHCSSDLLSSDADGPDKLNEKLYIARGVYKGKILYGKLCSTDNGENNQIYLAFGNEEIEFHANDKNICEVLVRNP
ncbi:uncharacterized protein LOC119605238 [Lucilia sericata]|uniref:uncharacterized protein LOC119605238 n=1 Tax=Lucilia sericata TaxID=13632 RepID=UPI0018A80297|nr:uncharacterized protein LOC119605238 [Lucilia sericata]